MTPFHVHLARAGFVTFLDDHRNEFGLIERRRDEYRLSFFDIQTHFREQFCVSL
jgi:hypothetical protein